MVNKNPLVSLIQNIQGCAGNRKQAWREAGLCVVQCMCRQGTSNSLKALSHSFCPAACWVQSVISWLILSVTALKHTQAATQPF